MVKDESLKSTKAAENGDASEEQPAKGELLMVRVLIMRAAFFTLFLHLNLVVIVRCCRVTNES